MIGNNLLIPHLVQYIALELKFDAVPRVGLTTYTVMSSRVAVVALKTQVYKRDIPNVKTVSTNSQADLIYKYIDRPPHDYFWFQMYKSRCT